MLRTVACASFVLVLVVGGARADDTKPVKNQMVKGTIKKIDVDQKTLVVSQKVKNENVDRELDIQDATEFSVTNDKGVTETATGKAGLQLLVGREGASIQVKCDKDVNVLKVTVKK